MRNWDNGHMDAGWGLVMVLGMLAFWLLLALAVVWLLRTTSRPQEPAAPRPGSATAGAEQILAERLARGDIDSHDYRERLTAMRPSG